MPLYMDTHRLDGSVTVEDVAKAHMAGLQEQGKHDVSYLRYRVAAPEGVIYCLVEALSADVAIQVFQVKECS